MGSEPSNHRHGGEFISTEPVEGSKVTINGPRDRVGDYGNEILRLEAKASLIKAHVWTIEI